nr:site-specific integrase [Pseudomonas sp. P1.8]
MKGLKVPGRYNVPGVPGMYLEVSKAGGKLWRLKYRLHGKENRYAIGTYPTIKLVAARDAAWKAKELIDKGIAPSKARKAKAEADQLEVGRTFEHVAALWLEKKAPKLVDKSLAGFRGALAKHIYPTLGKMPVADIKLEHVADVLTKLTSKGSGAMAKRCRTIVRGVLGFAHGRGWITQNPAISTSDELKIQHAATSAAALEKPEDLANYLQRLTDLGQESVPQALRLLALIPARPGELASMRWEDVDLDTADWRYVISKTKHLNTEKHIAVLPIQAVAILRELHEGRVVNAKGEGWAFPSPVHPGKPITPDSLLKAAQRLWPAGKISAHGFRSTFRTLAHEILEIDFVVLELMLSHKMPGPHGATYARAKLLKQRREAAQTWADYLDTLRNKASLDAP